MTNLSIFRTLSFFEELPQRINNITLQVLGLLLFLLGSLNFARIYATDYIIKVPEVFISIILIILSAIGAFIYFSNLRQKNRDWLIKGSIKARLYISLALFLYVVFIIKFL